MVKTYGGVANAFGRPVRSAVRRGLAPRGTAPDLENLRLLNFMQWFTGVVYYLFGINMTTGFFVFGLLAVIGSYFWYRATADACPARQAPVRGARAVRTQRHLLAVVDRQGSADAAGRGHGRPGRTSRLLRHRLASAAVIEIRRWLAVVGRAPPPAGARDLPGGCAYVGPGPGRRWRHALVRSDPAGLLAVVLVMAFALSQATEYLGMKDLSLSSIDAELNENTDRSSQGGSTFQNGDNSLNPLHLPQGAATVLLRPFPWETDSPLQLLASFESAVLAGLIVVRIGSLQAALVRAGRRSSCSTAGSCSSSMPPPSPRSPTSGCSYVSGRWCCRPVRPHRRASRRRHPTLAGRAGSPARHDRGCPWRLTCCGGR